MKWFSPKLWTQIPEYDKNVDSILRRFIDLRYELIFLYKDLDNVLYFMHNKRYYRLTTIPFSCYGYVLESTLLKSYPLSERNLEKPNFNVVKDLFYSRVYMMKRASRKTIADFYNLVDVPATILLRNHRLLGADDIFYSRQGKYGVTLEGRVGDIVLKDKTIYFRFKL